MAPHGARPKAAGLLGVGDGPHPSCALRPSFHRGLAAMLEQSSATRIFPNRCAAGRALGAELARLGLQRPVVLALPRGGVPVGYEVAHLLGAPLDVLVVRKVGAPGQPEFAIGAVASSVRKLEAAQVVVAVPVGTRQACDRLAERADRVVCLAVPEPFSAVGVWYEDFTQADDADVRRLLGLAQLEQEAHYQPAAGTG